MTAEGRPGWTAGLWALAAQLDTCTVVLLDRAAWGGVWIAGAVALYYALWRTGMPAAAPLSAALATALVWRDARRWGRQGAASGESAPRPGCGREWGTWAAACLLFAWVLLPACQQWRLHGTGDVASAFRSEDDAYAIMIAQALRLGHPAPELSYDGRVLGYHLGGPLLVDFASRLWRVPLHTSFYGLVPVTTKLIAAACAWRVVGLLAPSLPGAGRALAVLLSQLLILLHPYHLLWNLRGLLVGKPSSLETLLHGMPILVFPAGFLRTPIVDGMQLAPLLLLALAANLDRAGSVLRVLTLVAVLLTKVQVALAVGLGWTLFASWKLMKREPGPLAEGVLTLALWAVCLPDLVDRGAGAFRPAVGPLMRELAAWGTEALRPFGDRGLWISALLGASLLLAGTHVLGWVLVGFLRRQARSAQPNARDVLVLLLAVVVAGLIFTSVLSYGVAPLAQQRFEAIHRSVGTVLWMPLGDYIQRSFDMSIAKALDAVRLVLLLLTATAVVNTAASLSRKRIRYLALALLGLSAAGRALLEPVVQGPARAWKTISPEPVAALEAIPKGHELILTNELGFDKERPYVPLLNVWAPALLGQRFWASALMFSNNWNAPDAPERLAEIQWFFGTAPANAHLSFLRRRGITHLLVRRDLLALPDWEQGLMTLGPAVLYSGPKYVVLRAEG